MITKILDNNIKLFGNNFTVNKIEVGFTNQVYNVNDEFIVKIFRDKEKFDAEQYFYKFYKGDFIPKIYNFGVLNEKFYSITEKINGKNLYGIWHKLSDMQRKNIIYQLCDFMKKLHINIGKSNWLNYNTNDINKALSALKNNEFVRENMHLFKNVIAEFPFVFGENESVCLIHNDLHFDNVFYCNGKIKIIDFDRCMLAPQDYELGIILRMNKAPHLFANENDEAKVEQKDYKKNTDYLQEFYPEIFKIKKLDKRLACYDLIYNLYLLNGFPNSNRLKEEIINSFNIILNCV